VKSKRCLISTRTANSITKGGGLGNPKTGGPRRTLGHTENTQKRGTQTIVGEPNRRAEQSSPKSGDPRTSGSRQRFTKKGGSGRKGRQRNQENRGDDGLRGQSTKKSEGKALGHGPRVLSCGGYLHQQTLAHKVLYQSADGWEAKVDGKDMLQKKDSPRSPPSKLLDRREGGKKRRPINKDPQADSQRRAVP